MDPSIRKDITPREAIELQKQLRREVVEKPLELSCVRFVAGADISYEIFESQPGGRLLRRNSNTVYAGVVVMTFPGMALVDRSLVRTSVSFPYVPGLLSFRESPSILEAWKHLRIKPDVLLVDGHGLAHPRRFGIACHLGLLLNIPTIGCAKSVLLGSFKGEHLQTRRGSSVPLRDGKETIGTVLRTRDGVHPIYLSIGHRVDLASARRLVLRCATKYRLPEPTRQAHHLVNAARRGEIKIE